LLSCLNDKLMIDKSHDHTSSPARERRHASDMHQ
jgi:hypothetical protein